MVLENRTTGFEEEILIKLILVLHIIASGSITGFILKNIYLDIIIIALEMFYLVVYCQCKIINNKMLKLTILFSLLLLIIQMLCHVETIFYVTRFSVLLVVEVLFISEVNMRGNIGCLLEKTIRLFVCVALISYVVFQILQGFNGIGVLQEGMFEGYKNFFFIHYELPNSNLSVAGINVVRNCGIFWEPGILQIYCNLGLLLYWIHGKGYLLTVLMYVMCILTTFSTTGFAVLFFMGIYMKFIYKKELKNKMIIVPMAFVIGSILCIFLLRDKAENAAASLIYRTSDIGFSLKIFFRHLFAGTGLNNNKEFEQFYNNIRGNSNGLLMWLYQIGIVGMFFLIILIVRFYQKAKKVQKKDVAIVYIMLFIIENLTEPLFTFIFNIMIIAILGVTLENNELNLRMNNE
jgi:hypothetical protein